MKLIFIIEAEKLAALSTLRLYQEVNYQNAVWKLDFIFCRYVISFSTSNALPITTVTIFIRALGNGSISHILSGTTVRKHEREIEHDL